MKDERRTTSATDWRALYEEATRHLGAIAEAVGNVNGAPDVTLGVVRELAGRRTDYPTSFRAGANAVRSEALRMAEQEAWERPAIAALRELARRADAIEPASPKRSDPTGAKGDGT